MCRDLKFWQDWRILPQNSLVWNTADCRHQWQRGGEEYKNVTDNVHEKTIKTFLHALESQLMYSSLSQEQPDHSRSASASECVWGTWMFLLHTERITAIRPPSTIHCVFHEINGSEVDKSNILKGLLGHQRYSSCLVDGNCLAPLSSASLHRRYRIPSLSYETGKFHTLSPLSIRSCWPITSRRSSFNTWFKNSNSMRRM